MQRLTQLLHKRVRQSLLHETPNRDTHCHIRPPTETQRVIATWATQQRN